VKKGRKKGRKDEGIQGYCGKRKEEKIIVGTEKKERVASCMFIIHVNQIF